MALINGTYTISSFVGSDRFFLLFRDSAEATPVRGRPYAGSPAHHRILGTMPSSLQDRNYEHGTSYKRRKAGIVDSEIVVRPNRSKVWNIAGGEPVDHAHIILYDHYDMAENELWLIRPVGLTPISGTSSSESASVVGKRNCSAGSFTDWWHAATWIGNTEEHQVK
ncbi:hypothetical protein FA15DRAFT_656005 [Coprinopsis marcescibilis]|uniref:Uncharacterized protein n=1 Tax=Coprinopsis marcescibilis TaxID=230819 RepID=A0A5C3KV08_COPMA|nr:hypothetical protein FA15DRAFT_656005 [Coprinopsis marcescibilis]